LTKTSGLEVSIAAHFSYQQKCYEHCRSRW